MRPKLKADLSLQQEVLAEMVANLVGAVTDEKLNQDFSGDFKTCPLAVGQKVKTYWTGGKESDEPRLGVVKSCDYVGANFPAGADGGWHVAVALDDGTTTPPLSMVWLFPVTDN